MYTGRFAPSPSGPLHMGSLIAAAASWLDARAAGGRWLVRIEDLDRPRCMPGAADAMLRTLDRLGLHWDGEVLCQSRRLEHYRAALDKLARQTYWCGCTRREIADSSLGLASDGAHIYPGTCRPGTAQGRCQQVLEEDIGDFVLYRADGLFAYQLAVVVDDAAQGITDVVRGADLLDSTPRQIYLQQLLGLPTPRYLHVPVALDTAGGKLSKQTAAAPIETDPCALRRALAFLGQSEAGTLDQALRGWDPQLILRRRAMALAP